jgi:hypothetical protein
MFLAFNSGIESIGNSSIFTFSIPLFALYGFQYLLFEGNHFGVSNVLLAMFPDEHGRLPHFFLAEAGGLCSMGQHYLGSYECYSMHSFISATTGTSLSTATACRWPMAWTCVRLA